MHGVLDTTIEWKPKGHYRTIIEPKWWRKLHMNWLETPVPLSWMVPYPFLCIVLDYESSLLTTLNTPWRQYHFSTFLWEWPVHKTSSNARWTRYLTAVMVWLELEMMLSSMARMMKNITDASASWWKWVVDMALYSMVESVLQKTIHDLLWICNDKDGAHTDAAKLCAVQKMPLPETQKQLQKFLGMVTYFSPFVPSFSSFTTSLCELLKKGTEFKWNQSCQEVSDTVKCLICTDTILRYFDVHRPITILVMSHGKTLVPFYFKIATPMPLHQKP